MKDTIVRAIAADGCIRMFAASTTNLVEEARKIHNCAPTAAAALGRTLTAALMMGVSLKGEENVTLKIVGDGPIGNITAVADSQGNVKGYISNPEVYLPAEDGKMPVGKAVGKGTLYVIKDLKMREPYTGSIQLVSGEIAEDLTKYFLESEQIPSAVSLGILAKPEGVVSSGGYIIQMLPGSTDEMAEKISNTLYKLGSVSRAIEDGKDATEIVKYILKDYEPEILAEISARYNCECSRGKLSQVLLGLGENELLDILQKEGKVEARCHFCNSAYTFDREEIMKMLEDARS